jgi:8-oxo-dGTP diphosphatase
MNNQQNNQLRQVAVAILYQENKFLMQLRDDIPDIAWPGYWGLFGGHIEPEETPHAAVKREIIEEIGYTLPQFSEFGSYSGCFNDDMVERHVFFAPLFVELNQLILNEGWDMGLLAKEDIKQGKFYSHKAEELRPIIPHYQNILLDFVERFDC